MTTDSDRQKLIDKVANKPSAVWPLCYANIYARLIQVAREHGYALSLHGSLARDGDMIAIPWIDHPSTELELVQAILKASGGYLSLSDKAEHRPQGRMCWVIHLGGEPYIDLSVMPTLQSQKQSDLDDEWNRAVDTMLTHIDSGVDLKELRSQVVKMMRY